MQNTGDAWQASLSKRVGEAIYDRRKATGMTALALSDRCAALGLPVHRTTITKIEKGRSRFDLGELLVLAVALRTSPAALLFNDRLVDGEVQLLPGVSATAVQALRWFSGERPMMLDSNDPEYDPSDTIIQHRTDYAPASVARELDTARSQLRTTRAAKPGLLPAAVVDRALEALTKRTAEAKGMGLIVDSEDHG